MAKTEIQKCMEEISAKAYPEIESLLQQAKAQGGTKAQAIRLIKKKTPQGFTRDSMLVLVGKVHDG